ncbi:MAG TPA: hypothetical protein VJ885_01670 [Thermoanaerobaculia bacterium]|nr:hypothetical protein [Thermoanaerobaculia bacterium]
MIPTALELARARRIYGIGSRSERLVQFQVAPLRRRSRKKPDPVDVGASPAPNPGTSPETLPEMK